MKSATVITRIAVWTAFLMVSTAFAATSTTVKELWQQAEQGVLLTADQKAELEPFLKEFERRGNESIDAVGGPDGYGYYYVDNQSGDTASYNWLELRGDPLATWVNFSSADDASEYVPLAFPFPFYGILYYGVYVSTNGFLTFEDNRFASANQCLPTAALGGPAICAFWDDLHLHHGSNQVNNNTVVWRDFGEYVVIQFDNIGHYGFPAPPEDNFTFEILLFPNGSIKLQYQECNYSTYPNSQTIGIQQNVGGTALQYVCNNSSPTNGRAVWFYQGGFGSIGGHVTANGQPVYQATVLIEGTNQVTSTDGSGFFYFPTAPIGTHSVTARSFGYSTVTHSNITVTTNQMTTRDFGLATVAVHDFNWNHAPMAIPDRDTVYAQIMMDDNFAISGMAVQINNLTHTYIGDIVMWLQSPWGSRILLSDRNGGSGDNMMNCQLDDLAGVSVANGIAPFSNRYLPEQALAAFNSHPCRGTWTLILFDAANQDQGTLVDWTLRVTGTEIPEGRVFGYVTDMNSTPIANAVVTFETLGTTAVTNANGYYSMWLPVGQWTLDYSAPGYCEQSVTEILVNNNAELQYDVMLGAPAGTPSTTLIMQEAGSEGIYTSDFVLMSSGTCTWDYTISVNADGWLSVSPMQGSIAAGWTDLVTLTFNTTGLAAGRHTGELEISHNGISGRIVISVVLDLAMSAEEESALPEQFALRGNYPNPFNGQTEIAFDLPTASPVNLTVHNLLGQEVVTILNETRTAGYHSVKWTAQAANGTALPTGLYFLRLNAGEKVFVSKLVLTR
ncbi:carboxypeptidase regulatory-like domain-containing protein [bacterium]|nr:carboxypeptidase regulatory-like domain-containing protein [bacterium]